MRNRRRGFTFVDLIVVVVLAALIAALWSRVISQSQGRRARYDCMYNLNRLHNAISNYRNLNGGSLPRATYVPKGKPDVSGGGASAKSPFDSDGPPANNIPAAIYLLLRTQDTQSRWFICPAAAGFSADPVGDPAARSNFSDVRKNLGYSYMFAYQDLKKGYGQGTPLMADLNPGTSGNDDNALLNDPNAPLAELRKANSNNHRKRGQWVLYDNGSVEWYTSPFAGMNGDNIYSTQNKTVVDRPVDENDTIMLPTDD